MNPKKILLVRTDRIGELILTTPAFGAFREGFPGARITLMVKPSSAEAVEGNPGIDSVVRLDPSCALDSAGKIMAFAGSLRKEKYDLAVIFNPDKRMNMAVFLAGIPERIGYDRKFGFLLNRRIKDEKHLCKKHEVEYNLELAKQAGISTDGFRPVFVIGGQDEKSAEAEAQRCGLTAGERPVAVHPSTSNPEKQWPAERFGRLCAEIERELRVKVALVGGKEETPVSRDVIKAAGRPLCDLTGKLTLKGLGAFLKRSSMLISCDSGPVHVAAALNTPVIALFGESREGGSSRRWGPYGQGHSVIGKPAVCDITVEEVYGEARRLHALSG